MADESVEAPLKEIITGLRLHDSPAAEEWKHAETKAQSINGVQQPKTSDANTDGTSPQSVTPAHEDFDSADYLYDRLADFDAQISAQTDLLKQLPAERQESSSEMAKIRLLQDQRKALTSLSVQELEMRANREHWLPLSASFDVEAYRTQLLRPLDSEIAAKQSLLQSMPSELRSSSSIGHKLRLAQMQRTEITNFPAAAIKYRARQELQALACKAFDVLRSIAPLKGQLDSALAEEAQDEHLADAAPDIPPRELSQQEIDQQNEVAMAQSMERPGLSSYKIQKYVIVPNSRQDYLNRARNAAREAGKLKAQISQTLGDLEPIQKSIERFSGKPLDIDSVITGNGDAPQRDLPNFRRRRPTSRRSRN